MITAPLIMPLSLKKFFKQIIFAGRVLWLAPFSAYKSFSEVSMKKHFRKSENGQAMVEFALVLPILLMLVCGIIDFGYVMYSQLSLSNDAREAARYVSIHYSGDKKMLADVLHTYDADETVDTTTKSGVITAKGQMTGNQIVIESGDVTVALKEDAVILTGFTSIFIRDDFTLHAECTMRLEN